MNPERESATVTSLREPRTRFRSLKLALMRIGSHFSARTLERIETLLTYLWLGHWMKARGFAAGELKTTRGELFEDLARRVGTRRVLYLEFGVAQGASIRQWSGLLTNPESHLHGFDTFEGLPFDWKTGVSKGAFSNGGEPPQISDERVRFFKGLFDQTMPSYRLPEREVMIVNIDCDLYSSAFYVLNQLTPHLAPGDFIYFDEFNDRGNEMRAFNDFLASSKSSFRLAGATHLYRHVLFECVA